MLKRCGPFMMLAIIACGSTTKEEPRLAPFGEVGVPSVSSFVAADHFVVSTPTPESAEVPKGVWILLVDKEFEQHFLGKTERDVPAAILSVHTVVRISKDQLIVEELGDGAETSLAHLWALLERQPRGPYGGEDGGRFISDEAEDGILFIPDEARPGAKWRPSAAAPGWVRNVFYIRDAGGTLRSVDVFWTPDLIDPYGKCGWVIGARELGTKPGVASVADNGFRVFSRKQG